MHNSSISLMLPLSIITLFNFFSAFARNVRRNLSDEIQHNGVAGTISWVINSIRHFTGSNVKHPKPLDVALNNYHAYSGHSGYSVRPSEAKQRQRARRRQQRRPNGPTQQQRQSNFKRRHLHQQQEPTSDSYHSVYSKSFFNH